MLRCVRTSPWFIFSTTGVCGWRESCRAVMTSSAVTASTFAVANNVRPRDSTSAEESAEKVIKDAVGKVLADGDTVTIIKDLKVKGSPTAIKVGTKVRNIRLIEGVGDHDIDCKVDGFGPMQLKSSVVKKV